MLDINKYISFSDEFNINFKNCLIGYLKEYNKILNESKLNNLINFINNGIIELSCDGEFIKFDGNTDEYYYISDILICQKGKNDPLLKFLTGKLRSVSYEIKYLEGIKKYILNFNKMFKYITKNTLSYRVGKIINMNITDLSEIASESNYAYLDNIYEIINGKEVRKILLADDGVQIYKLDFGQYGIYIGQSKNIKERMRGHKNQAKLGNHCYILNELYKSDYEYFCECINNYQILEKPKIVDYVIGGYSSTSFEYDSQIKALRNGEKLLGRQCWDKDFKQYLAERVTPQEYQELLKKSFEINNNPNIEGSYSTYNPCYKGKMNKYY